MGKINEECLKNKIKEKIDDYGGIDNISSIIFTTYDFDTEFFENQLLPYLFDVDKENKALYIASKIEEKLKFNKEKKEGVKITVFYNHFINTVQANINYRAIPIQDKCLHAKLIIISGKKINKATIMVLSGNISISSYSTNQEICGIIELKDEMLIKNIENINNKQDLFELFSELNKIDELIITGLQSKEENEMIKRIQDANKIRIITPFIERDIVKKIIGKNFEILFTNLRGITNKESFKDILPNRNIYLYIGERSIHSKIYLIDDEIVILGSHNFTSKAIYSQNIEASIIIKNKQIYDAMEKYYNDLEKEELTIDNYNKIEESSKTNWNEKYISNATIDWEEEVATISFDEEISEEKIKLIEIGNYCIPSNIEIEFIKNNKEYKLNFSQEMSIKQNLMKSKLFKVEVAKNEYTGIFFEIQRIEKEKVLGTESFFNMIETKITGDFSKETSEEDTNDKNHMEKNSSINTTTNEITEEQDNYDTIKLFKYFSLINAEIEDSKNDKNKVLITNPDSIKVLLYNFLKLYVEEGKINELEDNKLLYLLLTANEIDCILKDCNIQYEKRNLYNVFCELKREAKERIKKNLSNTEIRKKLDEEVIQNILDIYLKYLIDNSNIWRKK